MPSKNFTLLALFLSVVCLFPAARVEAGERAIDGSPVFHVSVPVERPAEEIPALRAMGLDVGAYYDKTRAVSVVVSELELETLRSMGYEPTIIEDLTTSEESIQALSDYLDEEESAAAVTRIANDYPDIAQRLEYAYPTEGGRIISLLKISDNVETDEPEPRILFVAQHHAREVMTPEVLVDMGDYLTQRYGVDPEVTAWVDDYQIYIIPVHNPDGVDHVFNVYNNWRKNRRDNGDGTFGVDPNRNYPYLWGPAGCGGSDGDPGGETYRGPSAASEPETQGITELAQEVQPSISLTYHTSGQYVLMPFGCEPDLPDDPDRRIHRDVGSMMAAVLENDAGDGFYRMGTAPETLYDVDGDSDGWLHAIAGTVAFTIEMNTSFQPDYATWRDDTVARNREGWQYLLRRLAGPSVTGRARDACSAAGLTAEVGVVEQVFTKGQEPRLAMPGHGFFHRILMPGSFTWYGELAGYHRQEWPVEVRFGPVERDLWLVPAGSHAVELRRLSVEDVGGDTDGQLDPGEEAELRLAALATGEALTGLTATLSTADPYLEVLDGDAALPDLAAGAEGQALDTFRVRVHESAPDGHTASLSVSFTANEPLCRDTSEAELRLTRGFPSCPFEEERLDVDPAWTISGPSGGWEFGEPQGTGGLGGPTQAHTGDFVYGTNLSGNYGSGAGEFVLTSTPIDLQGLRDAELRFWRRLYSEPGYDPARVEVSIDGEEWIEVWRGFGRDTQWEEYRLDLPPEVDDASQVWLRFILVQDGSGSYSGFYIDDISFCGEGALSAGGKLKYESHTLHEEDPDYGNEDGELDTGETATLAVTLRSTRDEETRRVSAVLSTEAPGVTVHNAVAFYPDIPAGGTGESVAPHFSFTTGPECAAKIPFTLEARYEDGFTTLSHFTLTVGTVEAGHLFDDDMESDTGWTVSGDPGGAWERGEPFPNYYNQETTNPDADHTADPGYQAWNTQSIPPPGVAPPTAAEVDGTTILTSPVLAAGTFETLELTYWRWFYTGGGPGPDTLRTEATENGLDYFTVNEVSSKANLWLEETIELSDFVTLSDQLQLRFVVTDGGGESIVEAGLDDLDLSGTRRVCEDFQAPLLDPPLPVGDTLRAERSGWDVRLDWQAPPTDPAHGRATFYRVFRSEAADSGFGEIGQPTAPLFVDVGPVGDLLYYLAEAENSGGGE